MYPTGHPVGVAAWQRRSNAVCGLQKEKRGNVFIPTATDWIGMDGLPTEPQKLSMTLDCLSACLFMAKSGM